MPDILSSRGNLDDAGWLDEVLRFRCPRYAEFPQVELYMDQVLTVLEQALQPFEPAGKEKLITSTMINNYVKQGIVSPPEKKRYNRNHLAYLLVVCLLKQVLPIADICKLIRLQIDAYPIEEAYDYFCEVLEAALQVVFTQATQPLGGSLPDSRTAGGAFVKAAALAFANKMYLQKQLQYLPPLEKHK